jgi:dTDP-glucose 4,6-dehydratase/UDP-glucuronate decarboxylase
MMGHTQLVDIITEDANLIVRDLSGIFDRLSRRRMLLTGAGGFLCSYFLDVFAAYNAAHPGKEIDVLALDDFSVSPPERIAPLGRIPGITIAKHDVTQPLTGHAPFDFMIHGASIASPVTYRKFPLKTIDVNVNGTWKLMEQALQEKTESYLWFSSSEIYGDPDPRFVPTDENYWGNVSCTGPRACYDESKRLGETLASTYFRMHQLPVKTVRPFNVYGPGQRLDDQRIIPDLMASSLKGGPLVLFSDGRPTRSFCYASDFVRATMMILMDGNDGDAYNVGNDEEVSIRQVAEVMAEVANPAAPLKVEFRVSDDQAYLTDNPNRRCPDLTKLRSELGWEPLVPLREGLSRTLQYYQWKQAQTATAA